MWEPCHNLQLCSDMIVLPIVLPYVSVHIDGYGISQLVFNKFHPLWHGYIFHSCCNFNSLWLVTPYGHIKLGQHWLRQWLVAWWHQCWLIISEVPWISPEVSFTRDIKNNAWVTVNNHFGVTSDAICQLFSRVTKSRVKSLANRITSDPKIVIHGNECIILFLTHYLNSQFR